MEGLMGKKQGKAEVIIKDKGSIRINGKLCVHLPDGTTLETDTISLCRCGHSAKQPLCDGTHRRLKDR
jgi:CDGSH-type Zn-finger protein